MKLLVIAPYLPFPPNSGGAIRVYSLLKQLSQHHEILLAYPQSDEIAPEAKQQAAQICRKLLPFPTRPIAYERFEWRRIRAARSLSNLRPLTMRDTVPDVTAAQLAILHGLDGERPDLIHVHQLHVAEIGAALQQFFNVPALLDEQNVEPRLWERMAHDAGKRFDRKIVFSLEAAKLKRTLNRFYPLYQRIIAVSEADKRDLQALTKRNDIELVPNGVDTEFFKRTTPIVPSSDEILFTGTLGYEPNLDGLLYFQREIWPRILEERPTTRLLIVGRDAPPAIKALDNGGNVRVIGPVPDMRPYYERARVCVVPLRWGGGTRLKILEALAMQVPVVSTSAGVAGLDLTLGDHYLCGDNPKSFASLTVRLLDIKGPARHLAEAGRRLAVECYDWAQIMARLEKIYGELIG